MIKPACLPLLHRLRSPGGETPALQRVAALLFTQQRKYEPALRIYLRQGDPAVFDFVSHHALLGVLGPYAAGEQCPTAKYASLAELVGVDKAQTNKSAVNFLSVALSA